MNLASSQNIRLAHKNWVPGDSMIKNLPSVQETRVGSLSWEDSLEKEMATHFNILAWEIPLTEEPGRPQSMGLQKTTQQLNNT